jgi:hypothetical protein
MVLSNEFFPTYYESDFEGYPVATGVRIFKGALVSVNSSGYARPLNTADKYVGIAEDTVDNTAGSNGAANVSVRRKTSVAFAVTGATIASVGAKVYASDDNTLTLTASTNLLVGIVRKALGGNRVAVELNAAVLHQV